MIVLITHSFHLPLKLVITTPLLGTAVGLTIGIEHTFVPFTQQSGFWFCGSGGGGGRFVVDVAPALG